MTLPPRPPRSAPRVPLASVMVAAALFWLAAIGAVLTHQMHGRPAGDQWQFHEPMIRRFIADWPVLDFSNYLSATTPLYHVLVASAGKLLGDSSTTLRLVGGLPAVALVLVAGLAYARRSGRAGLTLAALAPLCCSLYVWPSAAWMLPDAMGWLLVLAVLLLALRPDPSRRVLLLGGAAMLALVLTRQVHLWAAACLWTSAFIGPATGDSCDALGGRAWGARMGRATFAVLCTLPAMLAVAWFAWRWHGLTPPRFQGQYAGVSLITPGFAMSLLAIYSVFFLPWLVPVFKRTLGERPRSLALAGVAGAGLALLGPSNWSPERKGGLWELVSRLPVLGGTVSVVILVLAPAGAVAGWLWLVRTPSRERWVLLAGVSGFLVSQAATPTPWQRYLEPMLLMLIGVCLCSPSARGERVAGGRWALLGPVLLALLLGAITVQQCFGPERADEDIRLPITSPHYHGPPDPVPAVYTDELLPGGR